MQTLEAIRRRRMVRRYDPDRPVPSDVLTTALDAASRAPSAGHTQGYDIVVLRSPDEREAFWSRTAAPGAADTWLSGLRTAPCLLVFLADPGAYLDRYAEPDKGWSDRDPARWPVPYWDVDTGMSALLVLLTAVDAGLGACFFGVPPQAHEPVKEALGIPQARRIVGVVSIGYAVPGPRSPSLRRGRRGASGITHWGRFGEQREA